MALPILQDQPDYEYYSERLGKELENTLSDSASAAFEMGSQQTIGGAISDINSMRDLRTKSKRTLSPQELNEQYRDSGVLFREATPDLVAEEIVRRARERNALNERIGTGPNSFISSMVTMGSSIGGNLWGSMTNPVDLAINVAAIPFTVGRLGVAGLQGGRLAMLARPGISGVLARGAAEGVISGAISTPLMAYRDSQEQRDWSSVEMMANFGSEVFTSAAFAGGVHTLGAVSRKAFNYMRNSDNAIPLAGQAAIDQLSAGKRPNVRPVEALFERHTKGGLPENVTDFSGRMTAKSAALNDLENVSGKFYYATKTGYDDAASQLIVGLNQPSLYDANFGEGIYLTNNAGKANNAVATGFNETGNGGRVFDADLKGAKLFDADRMLTTKEKEALGRIAADYDIRFSEQTMPSLRDVYDMLESLPKQHGDEGKARINQFLKEAGFDGIATRNLNGEDADGIMLFGNEKMQLGDAYEPNRTLLRNDIEPEVRDYDGYLNSEDSELFHNKVDLDSYRAAQAPKDIPQIDKDILETRDSLLEEMKQLRDEGGLNPEDSEIVDMIAAGAEAEKAEVTPMKPKAKEPSRDEAFKGLLAQSAVKDKQGNPKMVFHGTTAAFDKFSAEKMGEHGFMFGKGFYFAENADTAAEWASAEGGNIRPAFLDIRNPFDADKKPSDELISALESQMRDRGLDTRNFKLLAPRFETSFELLGITKVQEKDYSEFLSAAGFDGMRYDTGRDGIAWVAFGNDQVIPAFEQVAPPSFTKMLSDGETFIKAAVACVGRA